MTEPQHTPSHPRTWHPEEGADWGSRGPGDPASPAPWRTRTPPRMAPAPRSPGPEGSDSWRDGAARLGLILCPPEPTSGGPGESPSGPPPLRRTGHLAQWCLRKLDILQQDAHVFSGLDFQAPIADHRARHPAVSLGHSAVLAGGSFESLRGCVARADAYPRRSS